jgi:hypothetical protein
MTTPPDETSSSEQQPDTLKTGKSRQQILAQAQQTYKDHQQQLQALAEQQQREKEQQEQSHIQVLQKRINQDLSLELQQFLSISYKIHQSGRGSSSQEYAIATIQLPDEYDNLVTGYLVHQLVNPEGGVNNYGYRVILPALSAANLPMRGVYSDLSGGENYYCYQEDLNTLILRLIGEWFDKIGALKQTLEIKLQQQQEQQRQQQQQILEQQRQQELKAQQDAERQTISDQIQVLFDDILEQCAIVWKDGASVTCYEWKWATGAAFGEDGEVYVEYGSCFSFNDTLDMEGYIIPIEGRPIKLGTGCYPRVYRTTIASLEDCQLHGLLEIRPPLTIDGISEMLSSNGRSCNWEWGGSYTHHWTTKTLPVRWVREAIGYEGTMIHMKLDKPNDDFTAEMP